MCRDHAAWATLSYDEPGWSWLEDVFLSRMHISLRMNPSSVGSALGTTQGWVGRPGMTQGPVSRSQDWGWSHNNITTLCAIVFIPRDKYLGWHSDMRHRPEVCVRWWDSGVNIVSAVASRHTIGQPGPGLASDWSRVSHVSVSTLSRCHQAILPPSQPTQHQHYCLAAAGPSDSGFHNFPDVAQLMLLQSVIIYLKLNCCGKWILNLAWCYKINKIIQMFWQSQ